MEKVKFVKEKRFNEICESCGGKLKTINSKDSKIIVCENHVDKEKYSVNGKCICDFVYVVDK